MGEMKPVWETIPLPKPWESMTVEERESWERAVVDGVVSVVRLSKAQIEELYVHRTEAE